MKKNLVYVDSSDYDFGVIADSVRILKHSFVLYNTTLDTCLINRIVKSCGCTKVYCNKQIIPPEDSTIINVEVDLGSTYSFFERDINIYTSSSDTPITLYVRASRKMPMHVINRQFPIRVSSNVRLSSPGIIMGYIEHGEVVSKSINIINTSQTKVHIEGKVDNSPSYLTIYCPEEMAANEISRIIVSYDATGIDDIWGEQEFVLKLKEKGGTTCPITIYSIITECFDSDTNCKPKIFMPVTCYQLNPNENNVPLATKKFEIRNIGNGDLIIRDVHTDKGVRYNLQKRTIKPNENTFIDITIPHKIFEEKQSVNIGITTNDRMEPYKIFKVVK